MDHTSSPHDVAPRSADPAAPGADDLPGGNIDKVRDILFGGQMRDYERRFAHLEERLVQETSELRDEVRRRLAALEQFVKQEAESLDDRIRAEHDGRTDATRDLAEDARTAAKAFEKRAGQLDDAISRAQRDLRQQILDLQQNAADDLRQRIDDVMARLNRASADLRHEKTDRAALAALLTEMAMRLTNELSIPGLDQERHG